MTNTLAMTSMSGAGGPRTDIRGASTDAVHDYLEQIGPIPILTAQDEIDLAVRIEVGLIAGDRLAAAGAANGATEAELEFLVRDGRAAYACFVRGNLKLVVSVAKHYTARGLGMMDLIQNGNLGLDRAVKMFDYTRGFKFSTYAMWWIRQTIWQSLAGGARAIRIPVHTMEKINRLRSLERELAIEWGREVSEVELADESNLTIQEVHRLRSADREPVSLDLRTEGDANSELGDLIMDDGCPSVPDLVALEITRVAVRARVDELPDRESDILRMRFGLDGCDPTTLDRIGAMFGISKQRARQLELQALKRLRSPELRAYL
ncbi:MAG TPA: sigma-70 family RNA polymerase sigma factor [Microbacteriaceae bacterium]